MKTENDPAPAGALRGLAAGLAPGARLGIAVSGGSDSVAALVLAAEVLGPARVAAATVNHGLRPEAAAEAEGVAALCVRLGVGHRVLHWDGAAARGNVMDAARRARLRLLAGWAQAQGLAGVVLAHTRDDQAETVLMRLARGSGVDGLAGMAAERRALGVLWLRPFLGVSRGALRGVLRERGIGWIEDPTNTDPRHARARARMALAALAPLGIDAAGLAATAGRLARARAALEGQAGAARLRLAREERGTVLVEPGVLDLPVEIRDRVMGGLIRDLAGADYRPRLDGLHRALAAVARPGGAAALAGVVLRHGPDGLLLWREAQAVAGHCVPAGAVWDGRWRAVGPDVPGAEIRAMGQGGLLQLGRQARAGLHPHWRAAALPQAALAGLPGIWLGEVLIAAPLALWPQGWRLDARPLAAPQEETGVCD